MRDYSNARGALDRGRMPDNASLYAWRTTGDPAAGMDILIDWLLESSEGEASLVFGCATRGRATDWPA
jgi:hypothetical protein